MGRSVLVINCGSSSVKLALYSDRNHPEPTLTALAERLDSDGSHLKIHGKVEHRVEKPLSHRDALLLFSDLCSAQLQGLAGIGHRVVHGGEAFSASALIDEDALATLAPLSRLAPLHNPMNLMGIELSRELFPGVPNVAVFDTAFHQTLPEPAYLYGVPYSWYEEQHVRRYGFHGTSFRFITGEVADRLGKDPSELNLLIAHLGNGCSACAVLGGQSVDTTMGLTPLEGLIMGTRSGDIDPGLQAYMMREKGMSADEVVNALNRDSGLLGLSGISNDMRTLLQAEAEGQVGATRAIDTFCFRIARQLSALSTSLPSTDALIFTGGIGEHAADIRARILGFWKSLNSVLDHSLNQQHGDELGRISTGDTPLVMVIPTNEEYMIAQDTYEVASI